MSRMARREELTGWLMAAPWLIGFLLWIAGPFGAAAYLSFTDYDILSSANYIGLDNFREMLFEDELFWISMRVTTVYAGVSIPLQIILGLFLAILLNTRIRGLAWFRTLYYLPAVLSGVAVSFLWIWVFSADWGVLNYALSLIGIKGPSWLTSEDWALSALILMSLWGVGAGLVIYLAGLQGVPTELYEAADIDGAGRWRQFRNITLPMISPVILFQLIMGIIGALQTFTQGYVMTQGGPNNATLFFLLYLWRNAFKFLNMGYASALAWAIFAYILILTLLVLRSSEAWVFYTGEIKGRR
ncbi:sugar ABC transporter permease [Chloroflexi bacterium TSY]|nr:sugar ABC transporter permease [Chloroflexi bacterium TSY]